MHRLQVTWSRSFVKLAGIPPSPPRGDTPHRRLPLRLVVSPKCRSGVFRRRIILILLVWPRNGCACFMVPLCTVAAGDRPAFRSRLRSSIRDTRRAGVRGVAVPVHSIRTRRRGSCRRFDRRTSGRILLRILHRAGPCCSAASANPPRVHCRQLSRPLESAGVFGICVCPVSAQNLPSLIGSKMRSKSHLRYQTPSRGIAVFRGYFTLGSVRGAYRRHLSAPVPLSRRTFRGATCLGV